MSSGIIVCGIFFARHQLLRMEQLAIGSSSHFVDDGRLQIHKNGSRNMFTSSSFGEKCAERIVSYKRGKIKGKKIINSIEAMFDIRYWLFFSLKIYYVFY